MEDDEPELHTTEKADWDTPVDMEPLEILMQEYKKPHQFQWQTGDDLDEEEPWWMSLKAEEGDSRQEQRQKQGEAKNRKKVTLLVTDGVRR